MQIKDRDGDYKNFTITFLARDIAESFEQKKLVLKTTRFSKESLSLNVEAIFDETKGQFHISEFTIEGEEDPITIDYCPETDKPIGVLCKPNSYDEDKAEED